MTAPRNDKALREQGQVSKSKQIRNPHYSALARYESIKRYIAEGGLSPAAYTQAINRLAAMLGV